MKKLCFVVMMLCAVGSVLAAEPIKAFKGTIFRAGRIPSIGSLTVGPSGKVTFATGTADQMPTVTGAVNGKGAVGVSAGGQVQVAVFSFDQINLSENAEVTVTGDRALVLVSKGAVVLNTKLDLSGGTPPDNTRASPTTPVGQGGPGGEGGEYSKTLQSNPPPPDGGNGGPGLKDSGLPGFGFGAGYNQRVKGGTAGGGAGYGGAGGDASEGSGGAGGGPRAMPGGKTYGDAALLELFGGSGGAGGSNDRNFESASGGGGGGAVAIVSEVSITIGSKGSILAKGGNGAVYKVCGGGGSGGAVLLAAPLVTIQAGGVVDVSGGNGGTVAGVAGEIASGAGRRNLGSGGGGGGGRVAIYSNQDMGTPGKNKQEPAAPKGILLHGGTGGEAAKDGAAGTFYDGNWVAF